MKYPFEINIHQKFVKKLLKMKYILSNEWIVLIYNRKTNNKKTISK